MSRGWLDRFSTESRLSVLSTAATAGFGAIVITTLLGDIYLTPLPVDSPNTGENMRCPTLMIVLIVAGLILGQRDAIGCFSRF